MSKLVRFIQMYLLCALPFVIACMVWSTAQPYDAVPDRSPAMTLLWQALSYNLMIWFSVLILFLVLLVVFPSARERTLRRLANLKERDEREQYITGRAARASYIATLSLMIFFLFISVFSVEVSRPLQSSASHHDKHVSISLAFSLLEKSHSVAKPAGEVLFDSNQFSLSKPAIILILLGWQLMIFNFVARREQNK